MTSSINKPAAPARQPAIQGLRGLAIFAVLLYHLRPDIAPFGFLGVDVFFMLSGFLMCGILGVAASPHHPTATAIASQPFLHLKSHIPSVGDFYFRRIRRIIPPYLFAMFSVLTAASIGFVHSIDFGNLVRETWRPLMFAANIPQKGAQDYSVQSAGSFQFFRHMWSLSVELQFYALVPAIAALLTLYPRAVRVLLCLSIAVVSFIAQWSSGAGDHEHMATSNRLWQFMCGFLAALASECRREASEFNVAADNRPERMLRYFAGRLLNMFLETLLVALLFVPLSGHRPTLRLLILSVTGLVLSRSGQFSILSSPLLVALGDISYSVYLIHWPLIQWYFYTKTEISMPILTALIISAISIGIGYAIEKSWQYLAAFILNGRQLFFVVLFGYALIAQPLWYLCEYGSVVDLTSGIFKIPDHKKTTERLLDIWEGRDNPNATINVDQQILFNRELNALAWDLYECADSRRSSLPTRFDIPRYIGVGDVHEHVVGITGSCVHRGNGEKNIVVIGNSHAQASFFGIERSFRGVYKQITLMSAGACILIPWHGDVPSPSRENLDGCFRFIAHLFDVLEQWDHPIDVIMIVHAYLYPYDMADRPVADVGLDADFQQLQQLFRRLDRIAREVVFVPDVQFMSRVNPHMDILFRRMVTDQKMDVFSHPIEQQTIIASAIKRRVERIRCPKCINLHWVDIWCPADPSNGQRICRSVDERRQLSYFFDLSHVNAYGALRVGKYIRQRYDDFRNGKIRPLAPLNDSSIVM